MQGGSITMTPLQATGAALAAGAVFGAGVKSNYDNVSKEHEAIFDAILGELAEAAEQMTTKTEKKEGEPDILFIDFGQLEDISRYDVSAKFPNDKDIAKCRIGVKSMEDFYPDYQEKVVAIFDEQSLAKNQLHTITAAQLRFPDVKRNIKAKLQSSDRTVLKRQLVNRMRIGRMELEKQEEKLKEEEASDIKKINEKENEGHNKQSGESNSGNPRLQSLETTKDDDEDLSAPGMEAALKEKKYRINGFHLLLQIVMLEELFGTATHRYGGTDTAFVQSLIDEGIVKQHFANTRKDGIKKTLFESKDDTVTDNTDEQKGLDQEDDTDEDKRTDVSLEDPPDNVQNNSLIGKV